MENRSTWLMAAIAGAVAAGQAILEVYASADMNVEKKADDSPLTLADRRAHTIIKAAIEGFGIPVLSEEGRDIPYAERKAWPQMWIVDPLDGTKEFIKRNGEFTVNIALAEKGIPTMGVIFVPVADRLYFADQKLGAFKIENCQKAGINGDAPEDIGSLDGLMEKSVRMVSRCDGARLAHRSGHHRRHGRGAPHRMAGSDRSPPSALFRREGSGSREHSLPATQARRSPPHHRSRLAGLGGGRPVDSDARRPDVRGQSRHRGPHRRCATAGHLADAAPSL